MPDIDDSLSGSQFGFRPGRDTLSPCSLLNDVMHFSKEQNSPLYICSLDAEKCFDKIWHNGLFYKLWDVLPVNTWVYLLAWYRSATVCVRWQGNCSQSFHPSRGTKQGSLLSPTLFNIFIDALLKQLEDSSLGMRIDKCLFNSFVYADDVTVFSTSPCDIQKLIDICTCYSKKWRFSFGHKKTQSMIVGKCSLYPTPSWQLNGLKITTSDSITILGSEFTESRASLAHREKRCAASRRST